MQHPTLPRVELHDSPAGQWRLETGVGRLRSFVPNGPRYVEVTIDAPPLVSPVTGWADRGAAHRGAAPFTMLFAAGLAHAAIELHDFDVEYRVEVRRRQDVDASIPLEELEPHQKRRRMVWLAIAGDGEEVPDADVVVTAEPDPADATSTIEVDTSAFHAALGRVTSQVDGVAAAYASEWDVSPLDLTNTPPAGEFAWGRYGTALRAFAARNAQRREINPSRVADEDQLIAAVSGWARALGLPADERTVFTMISTLSLFQTGLVLNGRLCVDVAVELDTLIAVLSLLVPEAVIADA